MMTTNDGRLQTGEGNRPGEPGMGLPVQKRSEELRAELEAFKAQAEGQASARLEALRQALIVEINVRVEMYERMIAEVETAENAKGAEGKDREEAAGSGDPAGTGQ